MFIIENEMIKMLITVKKRKFKGLTEYPAIVYHTRLDKFYNSFSNGDFFLIKNDKRLRKQHKGLIIRGEI